MTHCVLQHVAYLYLKQPRKTGTGVCEGPGMVPETATNLGFEGSQSVQKLNGVGTSDLKGAQP